jgi:hypothetical protein
MGQYKIQRGHLVVVHIYCIICHFSHQSVPVIKGSGTLLSYSIIV